MHKSFLSMFVLGVMLATASGVQAHCEIPCGIYDDEARLDAIAEHATTVEKSINTIKELSQAGDKNYNQLVRWITNKEEHATKIQDIVSQYFLTQRIKAADPENEEAYAKYNRELMLLHGMMVEAMKTKQTTDVSHVEALRNLLQEFRGSYLHDHESGMDGSR